jgi:hypothetical protein
MADSGGVDQGASALVDRMGRTPVANADRHGDGRFSQTGTRREALETALCAANSTMEFFSPAK